MSKSKALVEYIARSLVDHPEEVAVSEERYGRQFVYTLTVDPEDMGRVIGKRGRMANAMRTLLRVAAVRHHEQVTLEIGE